MDNKVTDEIKLTFKIVIPQVTEKQVSQEDIEELKNSLTRGIERNIRFWQEDQLVRKEIIEKSKQAVVESYINPVINIAEED